MKTVKPVGADGGVPVRVKDKEANSRVKSGQWAYCEKSEWKAKVRDAAKKEVEAKARAEKEEREKKAKIEAVERMARRKQTEKEIAGKAKKSK